MPTLLLRLAAPLQSWGVESKFDVRRTLGYPTKSGVVGLIASAMGRSRYDSVDDLNQLKFGIRVDREGELIRDFHTASDNDKNKYITNRFYLSDAIFLVGLESDNEQLLTDIERALSNPAYPLFLGRRSCPPTLPIVQGLRGADLISALKKEEWLLEEWRRRKILNPSEYKLRIIADSSDGAPVRDLAVSFSPIHRRFAFRRVSDCGYVDMQEEADLTQHDPMTELR